ncbi:DEAD/DEAH box helicase [Nonomuraea maheshkhaliensis]|uniref:DEAD/DEAH box helicase n=1 Tax=Nonomuraea maheshkhaliensis TaxID=419590 RepID=A0ABN2HDG9_9ACTN
MSDLQPGVYQHLVTRELDGLLRAVSDGDLIDRRSLDVADSHETLARHLAALTRRALRSVRGENNAVRLARQVEIVNRVAELLGDLVPEAASPEEMVEAAEELLGIAKGRDAGGQVGFPPRPAVPLTGSALLVNGRGQPEIGHELKRELASADHVDLLCAFVKWNGVRVLAEAIEEFLQRGGRLRVVTTTYIGATDRLALDRLAAMGAEIRVSYDTRMTRLHAKAWLFHRHNGLSTAYVGSSNLSRTALSHGLEWNVRLAQAEQPHLIDTFAATFDDYWGDPSFEPYDPAHDAGRLDRALSAERTGGRAVVLDFAHVDVRPYSYQREILDELDAERQIHDRWHNLVVMATGTGKTVVAALDYRRLRMARQAESVLFVAHRKEILRQSLLTFRQVLRDETFGELYVDGARPEQWRHVFASIQTLQASSLAEPDRFDMVIVDEFHHAEAATYRKLLSGVRPKVLLGLTATPERADGQDIKHWFGGRIAAELRLWEALERGLLAPFQYFGVHDGTDLRQIGWRRGQGYDVGQLSNVYTGNDRRAAVVLETLHRKVGDVGRMRALGFCVSIDHARFMADRFTRAGLPSVAVTTNSSRDERDQALRDLRERKINAVFTVDLFNEGVDVPEIDTVLFLRPTDSATVFLQQLGRGLRLADDKPCLTVLDFVGHQHKQFRFDRRYRALTGASRTGIAREIEQGFPTLPAGCVIDLDRDVRRLVLDNVRQALSLNWRDLARELRDLGDVDLLTFLRETGLDVEDLYRRRQGWASLRHAAGFDAAPGDESLGRAFGRMLHIDDVERLTFLTGVLAGRVPRSPREQRLLAMLDAMLWGGTEPVSGMEARLAHLTGARATELGELANLLRSGLRHVAPTLDAVVPLHVHARYSKNEVLAAFGIDRPAHMREGVKYVPEHRADLFFVTIDKSEDHYSPTTLYHDRAISENLFQWESQSTLRTSTATARRYLSGESTVHLLIRQSKRDEGLGAPPYTYAGPMRYVSHEGERPVRFVWRLHHPLPPEVFRYAKATAG